jgi:hypothetical protein
MPSSPTTNASRENPDTGEILTIWDGHTTKLHPVTGKEIPDESARIPLYDYTNPRRAEWPQADFIVGNPPFLGASRMRDALGDGYTEALRTAWKGDVPESADLVMSGGAKPPTRPHKAAAAASASSPPTRFTKTFNRRVLEPFLADAKNPLHLAYAIPDHPWIDSADGAAVRIAMTVAAPEKGRAFWKKSSPNAPWRHRRVRGDPLKIEGRNETLVCPAPPSEPDLQISRIRLSS